MKALLKISEFQKITLLAVIFLLSFVFIALALFFPEVSHAAFEYKPLQPIQELGISGDKPELSSYLNSIFMGGIILAGVLAVVMITIGGFQYMSTDSIFGKSEGRQKILAAIGGLILALAAWLILNTINPKLVRQQIALDTIRPSGTVLATPVIPGGSATPSPAAGAVQDSKNPANEQGETGTQNGETRTYLNSSGIKVNKPECPPGTSYQAVSGGCTSVEGLRPNTIKGVVAIKNESGVGVLNLTGGSETGHAAGEQSHGNGYKVDLTRSNLTLNKYIQETVLKGQTLQNYNVYSGNLGNGQRVEVYPESDHWDIKFLE